jgi:transcription factor SPEECHLESS
VDYIKELQQLLQSLEAKKQRKAYADQVLISPRPPPACCSPRRPPLPLKSTPPMSPRPAVPISPRTPPKPSSPYKLCRQPSLPLLPLPLPPPPPSSSAYASPAMTPTSQESAPSYLPLLDAIADELCAYTTANKQPGGVVLPEVKVEFSGANLVVKTVSQRAPGQAVQVIAALEGRSLEIIHAKISTVDDTAVNSFTIKVCVLSSFPCSPPFKKLDFKISLYTTHGA